MADHPQHTILWQLILESTLYGVFCQNSFYFYNKDVIPDEELSGYPATLIDDFQTRILPSIQAFQDGNVHYQRFKCTQVIPSPGPFAELGLFLSGGSDSGPSLPSHDAAVLTLLTVNSGRRNRGRLYFAGLDPGGILENQLDPVYLLLLVEIGVQLIANFGPGGSSTRFFYCLYSPTDGNDVLHQRTFAGVKDIVNTIARRNVATQRHRKQGHGP